MNGLTNNTNKQQRCFKMKTKPLFNLSCTTCNYKALAVRDRYFDKFCKQDIDNRKCNRCNRLFVAAVTKIATRAELPNNDESEKMYKEDIEKYFSLFRAYLNWDNPIPGAELERVKCLWCGSKRNEKWNYKPCVCPKCGGNMKRTKAEKIEMRSISDFGCFEEMTKHSKQVVACYMANWCVPCGYLRPVIDELNNEYPHEFNFIEFNTDYAEKHDLVHKYKLNVFPTFLFFKDGEYKGKFSNVDTKPEMLKKMRKKFLL